MRRRGNARERYGDGRGRCAGCLGPDSGVQIDDLFLGSIGRALQAVAQCEAGAAESGEGLLKLAGLVVGRGNPGRFNHAQEHIVERIEVAEDRQHLAHGAWGSIGLGEQGRQVGPEIVLNLDDVALGLVAEGASLPFLQPQLIEGPMQGID